MTDFAVGDAVSYQVAGSYQPKYGTISGIARTPDHVFVQFEGDREDSLVHVGDIQKGRLASWWHRGSDNRWHSTL